MAIIVGCVGPKGGPGKSTMARIIATKAVLSGYRAKIADHDVQKTCVRWGGKREDLRQRLTAKKKFDPAKVPPHVPVEYFGILEEALAEAAKFDLLAIDAAGKAGPEILRIAQMADIVVMPLNPGGDDLDPTMEIHNALIHKYGIPRKKIVCVLNHVGHPAEEAVARTELADRWQAQILAAPLREMVVYRTAMTVGLSPMECKGLKQRGEAEAVADQLLAKIGEIYEQADAA